jgi:hypothetical protein
MISGVSNFYNSSDGDLQYLWLLYILTVNYCGNSLHLDSSTSDGFSHRHELRLHPSSESRLNFQHKT